MQPAAYPRSKIDRGPREKRPVVQLSILHTHWIKERRLCAVKACLLATHSDATCNPGKASDCDAITWAATIGCKTATHCLKTRRSAPGCSSPACRSARWCRCFDRRSPRTRRQICGPDLAVLVSPHG